MAEEHKKDWIRKSFAASFSEKDVEHQVVTRPVAKFDPYTYPLMSKDFPNQIPVFIEVSKGSRNKYEWDQSAGVLVLDRVLHSAVFYPYDYGFIPQTLCDDGDPLDILVIGTSPLIPGCLAYVRPIAYMVMEDEKGMDEKVLGVLSNDPRNDEISSLEDIPAHLLKEISHFFETYKALEKNKWAKVGDWMSTEDTMQLIHRTHQSFLEKASEVQEQIEHEKDAQN